MGRVVTDHLLRAEEQVVIISRHPGKVADLVARGARVVEGSIDDPVGPLWCPPRQLTRLHYVWQIHGRFHERMGAEKVRGVQGIISRSS